MRDNDDQMGVVALLLRDGSAKVSNYDPLLQKQSVIGLFNDVGAQLQEVLGDEDMALNLDEEAGGALFTLKVGDAVNEVPEFSPPEARWL